MRTHWNWEEWLMAVRGQVTDPDAIELARALAAMGERPFIPSKLMTAANAPLNHWPVQRIMNACRTLQSAGLLEACPESRYNPIMLPARPVTIKFCQEKVIIDEDISDMVRYVQKQIINGMPHVRIAGEVIPLLQYVWETYEMEGLGKDRKVEAVNGNLFDVRRDNIRVVDLPKPKETSLFREKYSPEDKQKMVAMKQAGVSSTEIGRLFGCTNDYVNEILRARQEAS